MFIEIMIFIIAISGLISLFALFEKKEFICTISFIVFCFAAIITADAVLSVF